MSNRSEAHVNMTCEAAALAAPFASDTTTSSRASTRTLGCVKACKNPVYMSLSLQQPAVKHP